MTTITAAIIVAAYASLAIELVFLHVPSVASSRNILAPDPATVASYSPRYRKLFELGIVTRVIVFLAPILVIYALFAFPLLVVATTADPFGDYLFQPGSSWQLGGIALILLGRAVTLWSVFAMRANAQDQTAVDALLIRGPFRWSRNPGLVGMYVFVGGLWITMPSTAMLIGLVVYILHMDFKVRMEEDFLGNRFGTAYEEYCQQTGRYLP